MLTLEQIIDTNSDSRELKRALAVKLVLESTLKNNEIANFLQVSEAFVSKWKNIYEQQGAEALLLGYNGKRSYLLATEKDEIVSFLKQKKHYSIEELRDHIEEKYHVVYKSKQSYYEIMDAAGLSWKKTEKSNPKKDETLVLQKQEGIKNTLEDYHDAIESGEVVAFMMDECHLLWGDVCGYVWGRTNEKIQVPVKNEKERQTYYGAVDYYTKEFYMQPKDSGNSSNTISFIEHLRTQKPDAKQFLLIWDGASYHKSHEIQKYLQEQNRNLTKEDWTIRCILFAPNAPEQNPVEDIWLTGKNFLRKHFFENKTFAQVKQCFFNFLDGQVFVFPKLSLYG